MYYRRKIKKIYSCIFLTAWGFCIIEDSEINKSELLEAKL